MRGAQKSAGAPVGRQPDGTLSALRDYEQREAQAFDRLASSHDRRRLMTTDWTFLRYRCASLGRPLFDAYPDLVFRYVAARLSNGTNREQPLRGLRILDLGAGDGTWSVILAEQGAQVVSLEISAKQVELARTRMRLHGLHWEARVGSAFSLREEFSAGSFDLVFGLAVLHHLTQDLAGVFAGVRHLLRAGGYGVFLEPYVGSPLVRRLRARLAWLVPPDRESPDERPLQPEDLAWLPDWFASVEMEHCDLLAKLARRLLKSQGLERRLCTVDRFLLRRPRLRALAGQVFIGVRR